MLLLNGGSAARVELIAPPRGLQAIDLREDERDSPNGRWVGVPSLG